MDPRAQFCHNLACRAYGERGVETIRIHSRRERRYRGTVCQTTFAETTDTPFYRAHVAASQIIIVLTLLAHGCPIPAIVAAFGYDERTVRNWLLRAGQHVEHVQTQLPCFRAKAPRFHLGRGGVGGHERPGGPTDGHV